MYNTSEVAYAGGVAGTANQSYYLYNNTYYWTMSPCSWNGGDACVFFVTSNGRLNGAGVNGGLGVRPVINLKSNTEFASGGQGTTTKPYVVS